MRFFDLENTVTRFGEISPFWQKCCCIWEFLDGLLSIWQNFESSLAHLICYWTSIQCCKWLNIEKNILQSGHTAVERIWKIQITDLRSTLQFAISSKFWSCDTVWSRYCLSTPNNTGGGYYRNVYLGRWFSSDSVWPDLPKFRHFRNILKALANFVMVYLVLDKI